MSANNKAILYLCILFLFACSDPGAEDDLIGQWSFARETEELVLSSSEDQNIIIIERDSTQSVVFSGIVSINGSKNHAWKKLETSWMRPFRTNHFFFYSGSYGGTNWGEHRLSIYHNKDTLYANYYHFEDPEEESYEVYSSIEFDYTLDINNGILTIPETEFYNESLTDTLMVGGLIQFPTVMRLLQNREHLLSSQPRNYFTMYSPSELDFKTNEELCILFSDDFYNGNYCGDWSVSKDEINYDLSDTGGPIGTYKYSISSDSLILSGVRAYSPYQYFAWHYEGDWWFSENSGSLSLGLQKECVYSKE